MRLHEVKPISEAAIIGAGFRVFQQIFGQVSKKMMGQMLPKVTRSLEAEAERVLLQKYQAVAGVIGEVLKLEPDNQTSKQMQQFIRVLGEAILAASKKQLYSVVETLKSKLLNSFGEKDKIVLDKLLKDIEAILNKNEEGSLFVGQKA